MGGQAMGKIAFYVGIIVVTVSLIVGFSTGSFLKFISIGTFGGRIALILFLLNLLLHNQKMILAKLNKHEEMVKKLRNNIDCPNCHYKFNDMLTSCPHCGYRAK